MQKKIIISEFYNLAAVIHKDKVEELLFTTKHYQVNSIYLGVVNKIFPSLNAAFVNIDNKYKSGFIHSSDLHFVKRSRDFNNTYSVAISDILTSGQKILVQITKEPALNKGPRLTTNLTFVGRYIVLLPFSKSICISKTVSDSNERNYLKALAVLLKPVTMGLLLKPSIVGVSEEVIINELKYLKAQWNFIQKLACISPAPKKLCGNDNLVYKAMRDFYVDQNTSILADSNYAAYCIRKYLNKWACSLATKNNVQIYNDCNSIFELNGITLAFKQAISNKVDLPLGAYIFIDKLEALTIIDVNSGGFNKPVTSHSAVLKINLEAAKEISYQLKLRNISGLIIIDFIDMQFQQDQLQLLKYFHKCLEQDVAAPQIVQLSELGLVELTRRRTKQSFSEVFSSSYSQPILQNFRDKTFVQILNTELKYFQFNCQHFDCYTLPSVSISNSSIISYQSKISSDLNNPIKHINPTVFSHYYSIQRDSKIIT
uniref:ribonuclease E n=1 Tax=Madagascaria erythrocladioides TaxID=753684 RepID=UPI001BEE8FC6|nr:ribonuclease E [Madagascaria erythrocladioides]QUE28947.1 Rne [Madagascaria erythrocladioides]UNJ16496.1 ribonuclease E [Madagascaria erythrocladioides]